MKITSVVVGTTMAFGGLMLTPGAAEAGNPGWIVSCNYSHSSADDPIVFPGQPGAAHMHDFIGARTTNASSTPESMRAGGTTCAMPGDSSGYWVPALFKDGTRVLPKGTNKNGLFYYRHAMLKAETVLQRIPDGFKMIVGNGHAESPAENEGIRTGRIFFRCGPGSSSPHLSSPPAQCADSGIMTVSYIFPNCWDGKNLDSADHKSHVAYPSSGRCPTTHPVAIPRIQAYLRYLVGLSPIGTVTMSSGPYYTAHVDFFNGWRPPTLGWLVDNCLNAGRDCGKNPNVPF